ncbi:MAG TPA: zinc ABC transporter substrate-binding protein [Acidimicrobiales bacterium]|nr:zinc ABC transporter substrate-binding protein [Acidimicrobiales bacterium]
MSVRWKITATAGAAALAVLAAACSSASSPPRSGVVGVVAAEDQYGNVASQVGGPYVQVSSVESDPNTDPHTYEVSPTVAEEVAGADLVIQNGLGYDGFMARLEDASPAPTRRVIDVRRLLHLPSGTANPHLWYSPRTMPAVAAAIAGDLAALAPAHAAYFRAAAARFDASLRPWTSALAAMRRSYGGARVAVTEPVADYLLQAGGLDVVTPLSLQLAVMNGTDPSPQDISLEERLLAGREVRVFVYNEQVTDTLTEGFLSVARKAGVPVVGVYETMPPHSSYQAWMLSTTEALEGALRR